MHATQIGDRGWIEWGNDLTGGRAAIDLRVAIGEGEWEREERGEAKDVR